MNQQVGLFLLSVLFAGTIFAQNASIRTRNQDSARIVHAKGSMEADVSGMDMRSNETVGEELDLNPIFDFSPDDQIIYSQLETGSKVQIFDAVAKKQIYELDARVHLTTVTGERSICGNYLAAPAPEEEEGYGTIRLYNLLNGQIIRTFNAGPNGKSGSFLAVSFSADCSKVLIASKIVLSTEYNNSKVYAKVWNINSGELLFSLDPVPFSPWGWDKSCILSSDGKHVLIYSDRTLQVYSLESSIPKVDLSWDNQLLHYGEIFSAQFSFNSDQIIFTQKSNVEDDAIDIFQIPLNTFIVRKMATVHQVMGYVGIVRMSPKNDNLIYISACTSEYDQDDDPKIYVFDISTQTVQVLSQNSPADRNQQITSMSFSTDGSRMATSDRNGKTVVWNTLNLTPIFEVYQPMTSGAGWMNSYSVLSHSGDQLIFKTGASKPTLYQIPK